MFGLFVLTDALFDLLLQEVLRICSRWSTAAHLDVDEIAKAPIFDRTLRLLWSHYARPGKKEFWDMLVYVPSIRFISSLADVHEVAGCRKTQGLQLRLYSRALPRLFASSKLLRIPRISSLPSTPILAMTIQTVQPSYSTLPSTPPRTTSPSSSTSILTSSQTERCSGKLNFWPTYADMPSY